MGKHSVPEPQEYPDVREAQDTSRHVLGLAHPYSQGGVTPGVKHNHDFEDWWEQYVTAPIEAANPVREVKTIPLTKNMPRTEELVDWGSSDDPNEVNMWRVFAYIIMGGMCAVLLFYALAAALAVIFLAIVVGAAWLGIKR